VTGTPVAPERHLLAHLASWLIAGAVIGWLALYTLLRLFGDNPNDAAAPALIGAVFGVTDPTRMSARDRELVRLVWPALFGVAAIAAMIAIVLLIHWFGIHGARPKSTLLMAIWDLVLAAWLFDEGQRVREFVFEGLDSLFFGCLLTMVLASIGISRSVVSGGQVILIAAAGVAAAAIGMLSWRLAAGRFVPVAAIIGIAVAALSLIAPLVA
jgi:hypothetical protein